MKSPSLKLATRSSLSYSSTVQQLGFVCPKLQEMHGMHFIIAVVTILKAMHRAPVYTLVDASAHFHIEGLLL